jgi:hypothetical protein
MALSFLAPALVLLLVGRSLPLCGLRLLDALQVGVEPLEVGVPEPPVGLHPGRGLPQRLGSQAVQAPLGRAAAGDQPCLLEHLQVP